MKWIKSALPHLNLMLSAVFITFYILDQYNPARTFLNRPALKLLLLVFAIIAAIVSILLARANRNEE